MMLPLANAGCAANTSAPATDLRPWRPITYSCKDTKETRQQILAHDSVYDSLANGGKVINRDKCVEVQPEPKKAPTV